VLNQLDVRDGFSPNQALAMAAALARHSLHPVSRAILAADTLADQSHACSAENVVEHAGQGLTAQVHADSAPASTHELRLGSAEFCGVAATQSADMQVFLCDSRGWLATFGLQEDIRPDAIATVAQLKELGMDVRLLSGDASDAAMRVATKVGIASFEGKCSPQDKLDFLRKAQVVGNKVAVVGDGLNDGPVLAGAHVSFAFGRAVPLAQAQADFLVAGSRLTDVSVAVVLARRTLAVVRQNLWWAAIYNTICVPLAIAGMLPAWLAGMGMASSSLLVVMNALRLSRDSQSPREV
jgi:Cu2+-exporting ATPase